MSILFRAAAAFCLALAPAYAVPPAAAETARADPAGERRIWMTAGEHRFSITLADNGAARAFAAQLPLTLDMPDLNADTLVVFYLTFDSPYPYTRLGAIEAPGPLAEVLGRGTVKLTFSKESK